METTSIKAFVGIDPEDTEVVEYGGAKFTLGVMSAGMWDRLNARSAVVWTNSKRRMIAEVAASGKNPDAPFREGSTLTETDMAMMSDDQFRAQMLPIRLDAVKYGLRAIENFKVGKRQREVKCVLTEQVVDGLKVTLVDEKAVKVFEAHPELLEALWSGFRRLYTLEVEEKKV